MKLRNQGLRKLQIQTCASVSGLCTGLGKVFVYASFLKKKIKKYYNGKGKAE